MLHLKVPTPLARSDIKNITLIANDDGALKLFSWDQKKLLNDFYLTICFKSKQIHINFVNDD